MSIGRLSGLQQRVLELLATVEPPWTLVGGAALVGFHTRHRETRDLDLFFRPLRSLGEAVDAVRRRLEAGGLAVAMLQSSPAFCRLDVRAGEESVVVDLVADPTPIAEPPATVSMGAATILVETPHQLLINKLCALLSRAELRDLVDVRALLDAGGELDRALAACPDHDAGFSPLTFGWTLRGLPVRRLGAALGWAEPDLADLEAFRDWLVAQVVDGARPDSDG